MKFEVSITINVPSASVLEYVAEHRERTGDAADARELKR